MKVQFLGAAQTVTGSCFMLEACGKRFCVDCGLHQGNKAIEERNRDEKPYAPESLDFVLVTHAHMDHSGLLPMLVKHGFKGAIYCTRATAELLELMLQDSAHIQEVEAQWAATKYQRRGLKNPPPALYTTDDAIRVAVEYTVGAIRRTKALDWLVENAKVTIVDEVAERAATSEADSEE